jgi:anti-anti-sigma factor
MEMDNTTVTRQTDARTVVAVEGDLVAVRLPELRSALRGAVAAGARELVLDLGRTRMIDSSGLGLLIAAHNSMRKAQGRLEVVHASPEVLDLLRTMRMHQHFNISGERAG